MYSLLLAVILWVSAHTQRVTITFGFNLPGPCKCCCQCNELVSDWLTTTYLSWTGSGLPYSPDPITMTLDTTDSTCNNIIYTGGPITFSASSTTYNVKVILQGKAPNNTFEAYAVFIVFTLVSKPPGSFCTDESYTLYSSTTTLGFTCDPFSGTWIHNQTGASCIWTTGFKITISLSV